MTHAGLALAKSLHAFRNVIAYGGYGTCTSHKNLPA
jgi:hypothetical protein